MSSSLIPLIDQQIGNQSIQTVSARELHEFLEVKRDFPTWFKNRVAEYEFIENQDFVCSPNLGSKGRGGHNRIEYHISLDMAKELSMVERNEKGKQARQYFIECEKKLKGENLTVTPLNIGNVGKQFVLLAEAFGFKGNQAYLSADKSMLKLTGISPLQLMDAKELISEKKEKLLTATELGQRLGLSAVKTNKLLEEMQLQTSYRDHKDRLCWQLTNSGKEFAELLDTGKQHSNGVPVQQIKWYESVINIFNLKGVA